MISGSIFSLSLKYLHILNIFFSLKNKNPTFPKFTPKTFCFFQLLSQTNHLCRYARVQRSVHTTL